MDNYWKVKPIRLHFNLDSDRDNVPDWKDCMPFNSRYHTISKTKREQLEKIPIYVSDKPAKITKKGSIYL